jgi:hypothetical protein
MEQELVSDMETIECTTDLEEIIIFGHVELLGTLSG